MLCTLCILNNVQDHLGKLQTEMVKDFLPDIPHLYMGRRLKSTLVFFILDFILL